MHVVDVFSILTTVGADGALEAHLAPYNWEGRPGVTTLCRLAIQGGPPEGSYVNTGCLRCAIRAVAVGIEAVREPNGGAVNLGTYVDAHLETPYKRDALTRSGDETGPKP